MANQVSELKVNEVSLVPKGANKKKFVLVKSDKGESTMEELLNAVSEAKLENEEKIDEICKEAKLSSNAMAAVKGALRLLAAVSEELPDGLFRQLNSMLAGTESSPAEVQASGKNPLQKVSTLFDLLLDKVSSGSDKIEEVAKTLNFDKEEIEKAVNGKFTEISKEKFVSLFKALELDSEAILKCVFDELTPKQEVTTKETAPVEDQMIQKMVDEKHTDLKDTILKELKDRDHTINSLKEEITKLKEAPIAATGEGANANETVIKSDGDRDFWAGVL